MTLCRLITMSVFLYTAVAAHAQAQTAEQQRLESLQNQVIVLQGALERVQAELSAMRADSAKKAAPAPLQASAAGSQPAVTDAPPQPETKANAGTIVRNQPLPLQSQASTAKRDVAVGKRTSDYEVFSDDPFAVARLYNVPLDPKYSGYFVLPGTETLLRIGGYFKTDLLYDLRNAGNPDQFVVSSIPNPQISGEKNTNVSIRASRLNADFRIPKSPAGDVRMYLEADLFGVASTTPRLRHGYAQVANILVGQTFTGFMDADAWPDTLDYEGPNSIMNVRNPQARYGFHVAGRTSFFASVERPTSEISTTLRSLPFKPSSSAPDAAFRLRYEGDKGHFQAATIVRSLGGTLANGQGLHTVGWGVSLTGAARIAANNNLVYQVAYGRGIGRYVSDTSGLGLDAALRAPNTLELAAIPIFAPYAGYQHKWSRTVRSSAVFGFVQAELPGTMPSSTFHKSTYSAANAIWNAVGSLNVGAEFLYGWAENAAGSRTNAPRFQISGKYSFVKVDSSRR